MKDWFTASELAGLPGMPKTVQGINDRAKREDWQSRKRAGRGGGREYHLTALPTDTRAHLAARSISDDHRATIRAFVAERAPHLITPRPVPEAGLAMAARLTGTKKHRMHARLDVLTLLTEFQQRSNLGPSHAIHAFCHQWNVGEIEADDALQAAIGHVHPATVYRWQRELREDGPARLAGKYGNRKGTSKIDTTPDLRGMCIAWLVDHPEASAKLLHELIGVRYPQVDISERAVGRWMTAYRKANANALTAANNPDAWKDRYMPAFGSASEEVERLNHIWELDSTPADVMLADGRRYHIMGLIDVWSRRPKFLLARTSTSAGIAHLVRLAILDWGVPSVAHTDNGQDYISHHLRRVFGALGIEQRLCAPFAAWQKPHIERLFRTLSHDLVELLPGYIGHSVTDRQKIEDRKAFAERLFKRGETVEMRLSPEQLQGFLDEWTAAYLQRPHEGLDGISPVARIAQNREPVRRITDERALDVLLYEAGTRTVGKKGIRHNGCLYIAPELAAHLGTEVTLRLDPEDIGRVFVFLGDEFLCEAVDPDVTGVSRKEVADAAMATSREAASAARALYRDLKRQHNTKDAAREILAGRLDTGNVFALPQRSETHDTPALVAAAEAAQAQASEVRIVTPIDDRIHAETRRLFDEAAERRQITDDPRRIHARWMRVEARVACGERVTSAELEGLAIYKRSIEYRSMAELFESFDLRAEDFA